MASKATPPASGSSGPPSGGTAPAPADPGSPAEPSALVVGTTKPTEEELAKLPLEMFYPYDEAISRSGMRKDDFQVARLAARFSVRKEGDVFFFLKSEIDACAAETAKATPAPQPALADGGAKNPPPTDPAPATPPVPPVAPPVVEPAGGAKPPETPPTTPKSSTPKEPPKDPPAPDKGKGEPPVLPKSPEVVKTPVGCRHSIDLVGGEPMVESLCICGNCRPVQQVVVMPVPAVAPKPAEMPAKVVAPVTPETPKAPAKTEPAKEERKLRIWPFWVFLVFLALLCGMAIRSIFDSGNEGHKETGKLPAPVMIDEQAREAAKKANERATAVEEQVKNLSVPHDSVDQAARDSTKNVEKQLGQLETLTGRVEKLEVRTVATQEQLTATTELLKKNGAQDDDDLRRIADLERRMPRQGVEPKNGPAALVSPPAPKPAEPVKTGPETWTAEERRIACGMISCMRRGLGANLAKDAKSYEFDAAIMQGWESLWDTTSKKPRPTEAELNSAFPIGGK